MPCALAILLRVSPDFTVYVPPVELELLVLSELEELEELLELSELLELVLIV
jgi:hypothetical protein